MLKHDYLPLIGVEISRLGYKNSVIVGGSYSYKEEQYESLQEIRDLDILLILESEDALINLLTVEQDAYSKILKFEIVEKSFSEGELSALKERAAGVRYSGVNIFGQKLSVKMLVSSKLASVFCDQNPGYIGVISKKDRRLYRQRNLFGDSISVGLVNQKISEDLVILADADLFRVGEGYSLGVVADVFLSGEKIHDSLEDEFHEKIENSLIEKIKRLSDIKDADYDWSRIFVRRNRFSKSFCSDLNKKFGRSEFVTADIKNDSRKVPFAVFVPPRILLEKISNEILSSSFRDHHIDGKEYVKSGPFSSNSDFGVLSYDGNKKAFFKEMLNNGRFESELSGLEMLSSHYPHLQRLLFSNHAERMVVYPWNYGDIVARKRLLPDKQEISDFVMELELRHAEDTLAAYLNSAKRGGKEAKRSKIHELFHGRLTSDRLEKFYQNFHIVFDDESMVFSDLLDMTPVINGKEYPSLSAIIKRSIDTLEPKKLQNEILICGLGDAHSGNIMCTDNLNDYLYIDYEFSGFHSPYLDMAKPIYNDVSFDLFYADKKPLRSDIEITIKRNNNVFIIDHNYHPSELAKSIFQAKIEGVIFPFHREFYGKKSAGNWWDILGCTMLCCGLFTRNLTLLETKAFWLNIANTIEMTDIKNFYEKMVSE